MRVTSWLASAIAVIAGVAVPRAASADYMDPALARLVVDYDKQNVTGAGCRAWGRVGPDEYAGDFYNPSAGYTKCEPDDAAFAKLIAQYGFAIAPTAMHSARTTGYGGFEVAMEAAYTKIDNNSSYWKYGTQGVQDPSTKEFSVLGDPDGVIQNYSLKIRKGFPFGLEITGAFGYLANTSIITGGADVRLSLLEGFRTGIPAIFPEIAAGGSVRTITGTEEFQLTVAGVDGQISKPIPIGGVVVLTPYVGYQWIRIFGDSGLIDLTPNTDSLNYCGYRGPNSPAAPDPSKWTDKNGNGQKDPNEQFYDGQPTCVSGSSADFNNTVVFDSVRLSRHRLNFGLQFRFQMVKFSTHFLFDLSSAADANKGSDYEIKKTTKDAAGNDVTTSVNKFDGVGKQWTLAFDLGAVF